MSEPMTVAQAIEVLSRFPADLPMWVSDTQGWLPVSEMEVVGDGADYNPGDNPAPTFVWVQ